MPTRIENVMYGHSSATKFLRSSRVFQQPRDFSPMTSSVPYAVCVEPGRSEKRKLRFWIVATHVARLDGCDSVEADVLWESANCAQVGQRAVGLDAKDADRAHLGVEGVEEVTVRADG